MPGAHVTARDDVNLGELGAHVLEIDGSGRAVGWSAPDDIVVVLLPDSGRGYLSKIFNDDWMADFGFLHTSGETLVDHPHLWAYARRLYTVPAFRDTTDFATFTRPDASLLDWTAAP